MVPKMGQIYEDGSEDYDGTFKMAKGAKIALPSDHRRLDSLLDTTNLALEWLSDKIIHININQLICLIIWNLNL